MGRGNQNKHGEDRPVFKSVQGMERAGMFDHILSSEQISFLNGCVRRWKAELQAGICFSPPSPTPGTLRDISPFLVLKVAWKLYSETGAELGCCI